VRGRGLVLSPTLPRRLLPLGESPVSDGSVPVVTDASCLRSSLATRRTCLHRRPCTPPASPLFLHPSFCLRPPLALLQKPALDSGRPCGVTCPCAMSGVCPESFSGQPSSPPQTPQPIHKRFGNEGGLFVAFFFRARRDFVSVMREFSNFCCSAPVSRFSPLFPSHVTRSPSSHSRALYLRAISVLLMLETISHFFQHL